MDGQLHLTLNCINDMSKVTIYKGKKYFHNKLTAEQKSKIKESNPRLYVFMFGDVESEQKKLEEDK